MAERQDNRFGDIEGELTAEQQDRLSAYSERVVSGRQEERNRKQQRYRFAKGVSQVDEHGRPIAWTLEVSGTTAYSLEGKPGARNSRSQGWPSDAPKGTTTAGRYGKNTW